MSTYTEEDLDRVRVAYRHGGGDDEAFAQLIADQREADARVCDSYADSPSRTVSERALARQIGEQIRRGRP